MSVFEQARNPSINDSTSNGLEFWRVQ